MSLFFALPIVIIIKTHQKIQKKYKIYKNPKKIQNTKKYKKNTKIKNCKKARYYKFLQRFLGQKLVNFKVKI
jgi:hypothetical protein